MKHAFVLGLLLSASCAPYKAPKPTPGSEADPNAHCGRTSRCSTRPKDLDTGLALHETDTGDTYIAD